MMSFDELAATGRAALLRGDHHVEASPDRNGPRWGMSVVLRLPDSVKGQLAQLTQASSAIAGDHHWATGMPDRVHITVRALEPRQSVHRSHSKVLRVSQALTEAAASSAPPLFRPVRLLVSPVSVMLGLSSVGSNADDFAAALENALGDDASHEAGNERQFWYLNLVHFAGPVDHPRSLLQWTETAVVPLDDLFKCPSAALVYWEFDGGGMAPAALTETAFTSGESME